jgi:diguanylate cyclase (GGDEF)-like protein
MQLDTLKEGTIKITPVKPPVRLSEAFRIFHTFDLNVIPVLDGRHLKGLYFKDLLPLITDCRNSSVCAVPIKESFFKEIEYIDTSENDPVQLSEMEHAIQSESSAALMMGGVYLGMVPLKRIISFTNEQRLYTALMTSPLTGLPGNLAIKKEFQSKAAAGEPFDIGYLDINDFKAYNDKYGVAKGDDAIKFTALLLTRHCKGGFVGHIGGDDFIFFLQKESAESTLLQIVSDFDKSIVEFYREDHRKQGHIISMDREGKVRRFPLMSASLAIMEVEKGESFDKISEQLVGLKEQAKQDSKQQGGSRYAFGSRHNTAS